LISEKPSEELFQLDSTPSTEILKQVRKQYKALKADEILSQRSSIPAVDTRKRGNSIVTDGVIIPKVKKQRTDWVSHKEWHRLKKVALEHRPMKTNEGEVTHDPWEDNVQPSPYDDPRLNFLEKPKPIVAPSTLERKPISLAANGKPVPAVRKPDAGISYNPTFEDWDTLIVREGEKEIEAEKKRLEVLRKDEERKRLIAEAKDGDGEIRSDDESAWEGFESDYEKAEWLNKKLPKRKTLAERNRIKRRKETERKAKWEAQTRKRDQQGEHITSIATKVKEEEEARQRLQGRSDSSDEGDDVVLRRRPLGKNL
jgi:nucleolar protein 53